MLSAGLKVPSGYPLMIAYCFEKQTYLANQSVPVSGKQLERFPITSGA